MKKLLVLCLFLSGCASELEFIQDPLYVPDLTNQVCAKYKVTDRKKLLWELQEELPLVAGGPCDRMVGFDRPGFTKLKNWAREQIKKSERQVEMP